MAVEEYAGRDPNPTAEGALKLANQYQSKGRVSLQFFMTMPKQGPQETVEPSSRGSGQQHSIFSKPQESL